MDPVARGGEATVERMRLRCRAHNQYEAERAFGVAFMVRKRVEKGLAAAEARLAGANAWRRASGGDLDRDVLAGLRGLGCRAEQARRAAEFSGTLHGAALEERLRAALQYLGGR
jgi:hypothetical protein